MTASNTVLDMYSNFGEFLSAPSLLMIISCCCGRELGRKLYDFDCNKFQSRQKTRRKLRNSVVSPRAPPLVAVVSENKNIFLSVAVEVEERKCCSPRRKMKS